MQDSNLKKNKLVKKTKDLNTKNLCRKWSRRN